MSVARKCLHCGLWHDVTTRCTPQALAKAWDQVTDDDRRLAEQAEEDAMRRYDEQRRSSP